MRGGHIVAIATWLFACGGESRAPVGRAREPSVVVARVDGAPVGRDEVLDVLDAGAPSLDAALRLLEDARLLEARAAARGYDGLRSVRTEQKRALVRALLAREIPSDAGEAASRAAYEALVERLKREDRVQVHEEVVREALADGPDWDAILR